MSVEVTNKNELIKRFQTKCTKLETELVQLQAQLMQGATESSLEDGSEQAYGLKTKGPHKTPQPSGVSSKLKNFFSNKFKKSGRASSTNSSAQNSAQTEQIGNMAIGIQDMDAASTEE